MSRLDYSHHAKGMEQQSVNIENPEDKLIHNIYSH